jgi:hypothetical protein
MTERPSFDLTRLTTADKILLVASALLFIDSFLPWQRVCVGANVFRISLCASASEWGGTAAAAGVLAALFTIALLAWKIISLAAVDMNFGVSPSNIGAGLVLGTSVLTILKFILVIGKALSFGAWIGLILALAVAYGGYMKMQEVSTSPPASDAGGSTA